ncbi:ferredoxin [Nonomuraea sp. NPDC049400]|uniref:ferredoxin n=1 Tax=Nonomuraea sp. NPDC049400 TaxID=3364352 RepID=UPI0037AF5462
MICKRTSHAGELNAEASGSQGARTASSPQRGQWRISIDTAACQGTGLCVASTSKRFTLLDGHAQPLAEVTHPDEELAIVADLCPSAAITLTDAETGEPVSARTRMTALVQTTPMEAK